MTKVGTTRNRPATTSELNSLVNKFSDGAIVYKEHTMAIPPPDPTSNRSKGGRQRGRRKAKAES